MRQIAVLLIMLSSFYGSAQANSTGSVPIRKIRHVIIETKGAIRLMDNPPPLVNEDDLFKKIAATLDPRAIRFIVTHDRFSAKTRSDVLLCWSSYDPRKIQLSTFEYAASSKESLDLRSAGLISILIASKDPSLADWRPRMSADCSKYAGRRFDDLIFFICKYIGGDSTIPALELIARTNKERIFDDATNLLFEMKSAKADAAIGRLADYFQRKSDSLRERMEARVTTPRESKASTTPSRKEL